MKRAIMTINIYTYPAHIDVKFALQTCRIGDRLLDQIEAVKSRGKVKIKARLVSPKAHRLPDLVLPVVDRYFSEESLVVKTIPSS